MARMDRRAFMRGIAAAGVAASAARSSAGQPAERPNFLLITADDLNYDSVGAWGCPVPGVTPNIDRLAAEGMRFDRGHVTIAVCQPCRSVLMTGRYPHRNGAEGFEPIDRSVPTLGESLRAAGWRNGILGKVIHTAPIEKFAWDLVVQPDDLGVGRDPSLYYSHTREFLEAAKRDERPFFLYINTHDPHRPFVGSQQEERAEKRRKVEYPGAGRVYRPDEIEVPGFLPDLPDIRTEVAQYFSSVHRCDASVGAILRALRETGFEDNTLVMFISDNGMAFPFAKTNVYLNSTKTPWIVRWPGRVEAGCLDREHFISGIDFMPTVLDAAGIEAPAGMDGRSFLPVLRGEKQEGRDSVYTVFHETSARRAFPMRCLHQGRFGYIFNAWADGETVFRNESQSGLTFRAMQEAAKTNEEIAARVRLFQYRVPEELFDFDKDPDALNNLIADPKYSDTATRMRRAMLATMEEVADPVLPLFQRHLLSL